MIVTVTSICPTISAIADCDEDCRSLLGSFAVTHLGRYSNNIVSETLEKIDQLFPETLKALKETANYIQKSRDILISPEMTMMVALLIVLQDERVATKLDIVAPWNDYEAHEVSLITAEQRSLDRSPATDLDIKRYLDNLTNHLLSVLPFDQAFLKKKWEMNRALFSHLTRRQIAEGVSYPGARKILQPLVHGLRVWAHEVNRDTRTFLSTYIKDFAEIVATEIQKTCTISRISIASVNKLIANYLLVLSPFDKLPKMEGGHDNPIQFWKVLHKSDLLYPTRSLADWKVEKDDEAVIIRAIRSMPLLWFTSYHSGPKEINSLLLSFFSPCIVLPPNSPIAVNGYDESALRGSLHDLLHYSRVFLVEPNVRDYQLVIDKHEEKLTFLSPLEQDLQYREIVYNLYRKFMNTQCKMESEVRAYLWQAFTFEHSIELVFRGTPSAIMQTFARFHDQRPPSTIPLKERCEYLLEEDLEAGNAPIGVNFRNLSQLVDSAIEELKFTAHSVKNEVFAKFMV